MDHIFLYDRAYTLRRMIMDYCCIGPTTTDCCETQPSIVFLLFSQIIQIFGGLVLINLIQFGSPSPKFCHRYSISNMASSKTIYLFVCSHNSIHSYSIPSYRLFDAWKYTVVKLIRNTKHFWGVFGVVWLNYDICLTQMLNNFIIFLRWMSLR